MRSTSSFLLIVAGLALAGSASAADVLIYDGCAPSLHLVQAAGIVSHTVTRYDASQAGQAALFEADYNAARPDILVVGCPVTTQGAFPPSVADPPAGGDLPMLELVVADAVANGVGVVVSWNNLWASSSLQTSLGVSAAPAILARDTYTDPASPVDFYVDVDALFSLGVLTNVHALVDNAIDPAYIDRSELTLAGPGFLAARTALNWDPALDPGDVAVTRGGASIAVGYNASRLNADHDGDGTTDAAEAYAAMIDYVWANADTDGDGVGNTVDVCPLSATHIVSQYNGNGACVSSLATTTGSVIGPGATVMANANITGATIGARATIGVGAGVAGATIGPKASVGAGASLGSGSVVGRRASIGANTALGTGVTIARAVTVGSDLVPADGVAIDGLVLGYGSSIGDGATVGDGVRVANLASVGSGATLATGSTVGRGATVGAGASLGAGARLGGGALLGDGSTLGADASLGRAGVVGALGGTGATVGTLSRLGRSVTVQDTATVGDRVVARAGSTVTSGATVPNDTHIDRGASYP